MPLPPPLGSGEIRFWRLDDARHAASWNSGEGAFLLGGRWNSPGIRAVYTSLDPATAIIEVAVHKGFKALDTVAHVLSSAAISDPSLIHVVQPDELPNPNWLVPGAHNPGQRAFGDRLLRDHVFTIVPSTVSRQSWNLIFDADRARSHYRDAGQERFALDPRLHQ